MQYYFFNAIDNLSILVHLLLSDTYLILLLLFYYAHMLAFIPDALGMYYAVVFILMLLLFF